MGSQQILLIILALIIVGITVAIAIILINRSSISNNRSELASELQRLSTLSLYFWRTPILQGGGGNKFNNTLGDQSSEFRLQKWLGFNEFCYQNEVAAYTITATYKDSLIIEGLGYNIGSDGKTGIKAIVTVKPQEKDPVCIELIN